MRSLKKKDSSLQDELNSTGSHFDNDATAAAITQTIKGFFAGKSESSELNTLLQKYRQRLDDLRYAENTTPTLEQGLASRDDTLPDNGIINPEHPSAARYDPSRDADTQSPVQATLQSRVTDKAKVSRLLDDVKRTRTEIMDLLNNVIASIEQKPKRWNISRGAAVPDLSPLMRVLNTLFSHEQPLATEQSRSTDSRVSGDITPQHVEIPFLDDVRAWLLHVASTFLSVCDLHQRTYILLSLLQTPFATKWAMSLLTVPLAPLAGQSSQLATAIMEGYIASLCSIFDHSIYPAQHRPRWTEDDYIAGLDTLSVEQSYSDFLKTPLPQTHPLDYGSDSWAEHVDQILSFSNHLVDALLAGIRSTSGDGYVNLTKRLAQTTAKVAQRLAEHATDNLYTQRYQPQIDAFMNRVVHGFLDSNNNASLSHFLPALPFRLFSTLALWRVTLRLLCVDDSSSQNVLNDIHKSLPDVSSFLRLLAANQTQGVFLLSSLSNILICIPTVDRQAIEAGSNDTSVALIKVVAHTLFTIAFRDKELGDIYYKDVRDHFDPICNRHPFVMSLLLRWTYDHFLAMDHMALYLFRSLPLSRWEVTKEDVGVLSKLMGTPPAASVQVNFARFVVDGLNFGYHPTDTDAGTSNSQPWHARRQPILHYDIHQQIAFMLLDACQKHQPLAEKGDKAGPVASHLSKADMPKSATSHQVGNVAGSTTDFIDWAWKIALQLKLYDCPVVYRNEAEEHMDLSSLKDYLNHPVDSVAMHGALVVYVDFMLSMTSRLFLYFMAGHGWIKLLLLLRRGKPAAVIQILCEVIPVFVYLHGDDFFIDESLPDFLKHMVELKSDPMLAKEAAASIPDTHLSREKRRMTGVSLMIGSTVWHGHLIDSTSELKDPSGNGFSYCDLLLHSWLQILFRRQDWMWQESYITLVDCICKIAFSLSRFQLVRDMLSAELKSLKDGRLQQTSQGLKSGPLGQQRNPLRLIKNILPDAAYSTLLVGEWSMLSLTTGNIFKTPSVERRSLWFAFEALMLETAEEQAYRLELARQVSMTGADFSNEADMTALFKTLDSQHKKPSEYTAIYRWLQHILAMPSDHALLPLYLQAFFCLYYASVVVNESTYFYGRLFFVKKQDLLQKLSDHIAHLQTFQGQQQSVAHSKSLATSIRSHSERLRQAYHAMWLWLSNPDGVQPDQLSNAPSQYCPKRLEQCMQKDTFDTWEAHQPWNNTKALWLDLVCLDRLENDFIQFPWQGAEKFRTKKTPLSTVVNK